MPRKLMAILISSALVFGNISTSAWSADATAKVETQAASTIAAKNQSPLPPGGAAGIKQAQGYEDGPWLGIGLLVGLFVLGVILLDDEDDDESTSTTSTGS